MSLSCVTGTIRIFAKTYKQQKILCMSRNSGNTLENTLLTVLAYPGVAIRYCFYGTKRPVRELLEDGLDINVFAFLWLFLMAFTWSSILHKL